MEQGRENLEVRKERAILVGAIVRQRGGHGRCDNLAELSALAESAGAIIVDRFQQKVRKIHSATYIGSGKAEQLGERVERFEADVVIFDNDLSPGQIRELEKKVETKVIDRSELILDIFASRAKTKQARLQVELAQLEYTYPRLTRMWGHLDTVAGAAGGTAAGAVGGIGTRGTGEKQLEIDRRLVNKRITDLKRQLAAIDKRRNREIDSRRGMFKACLVGYTNAGKSTLMNALTNADVLVEDRLFATLDTRTRKWTLDGGHDVLLSDTVGFIRKLPHQLVESFKATLEEAVQADLLLHIIDVSSPEATEQINAVKQVLGDIGCGKKPVLLIFNKTDIAARTGQIEVLQTIYPDALCISAKAGFALEDIAGAVLQKCRGRQLHVRVRSGHNNGKVQSFMRAFSDIVTEGYERDSVLIEAWLGDNQLVQLKKLRPDELEILTAGGE